MTALSVKAMVFGSALQAPQDGEQVEVQWGRVPKEFWCIQQ